MNKFGSAAIKSLILKPLEVYALKNLDNKLNDNITLLLNFISIKKVYKCITVGD